MTDDLETSDGAVRPDRSVVSRTRRLWEPALLALVVCVLAFGGIVDRPILDDEAISLLEVSGHAEPSWPEEPMPAGELRSRMEGRASLVQIAADLRATDVHPPVYYWGLASWRRAYGTSLVTSRAFSTLAVLGAVWIFWAFLRAARCPKAFWPALSFAVASGVVYYGQIARPYSLALFFVCLTVYCLHRAAARRESTSKRPISGWVAAICGALAFATHYFTVFPLAVFFAGFAIRRWGESRAEALGVPLVGLLLSLPTLALATLQAASPVDHAAGFSGGWMQFRALVAANYTNLVAAEAVWLKVCFLFVALFALSATIALRDRLDGGLLLLFVGWALAPSVGLLLVNLAFDKHFDHPRYLLWATPAWAALLTYGLLHLRRGVWVAVLLVFVQAQGSLSWQERTKLSGPSFEFLAEQPERWLLLVGAGHGRGHPALVIYRLPPQVAVFVLDEERDVDRVTTFVSDYLQVMVVPATDGQTRELEEKALARVNLRTVR